MRAEPPCQQTARGGRRRRLAARSACIAAAWALSSLGAAPLLAQRSDSARAGVSARVPRTPAPGDSLLRRPISRPPISPGRAFLASALVPGLGQAALHRSTAGTLFATVEAISVAMLIQSKRELARARRFAPDSIVDHYEPGQDGAAPTPVYAPNPLAGRVKPREQAVEDWAALLIFNHLISGADAFVAAHLWDVPVEVSGRSTSRGAQLAFRVTW